MAYFTGELRSAAVGTDMRVNVLLPQDHRVFDSEKPVKILYLLHGYKNSGSSWQRYTDIERFTLNRNLMVVLPEMHNSYYMDMAYGGNYFTYLTQELPNYLRQIFRFSQKREDTFVAGMSMGGYGALKCALRHPEIYGAAAIFSTAADLHFLSGKRENGEDILLGSSALFGVERKIQPDDDLFALARKVAQLPKEQLPHIYHACGTEDFVYDGNRRVKEMFQSLPYPYRYEEWQGGHDWRFWEQAVRKALDYYFPREEKG